MIGEESKKYFIGNEIRILKHSEGNKNLQLVFVI